MGKLSTMARQVKGRERLRVFRLPVLFAAVLSACWWPPPLEAGGTGAGAGAAASGGAALDALAVEAAGDGWRARAEPAYRRALEAWEMVQRFAGRLNDRSGIERAARQRAGLLVTLLDARSFAALSDSAEKNGLAPAAPLPSTVADPAGLPARPTEEDLRALAAFLGDAGRAYFRSSEKEVLDLPVLFESLALSERLLADVYQARADVSYRQALAAAGSEPAETRARAAVVRIRYKLRELDGARAALAAAPLDDRALPEAERLEHLRIQRDLARFTGASQAALAYAQRLVELGAKAEEVALPAASLATFVAGTAADLARAARTLLSVVETRRLSPRERLMAESLAGQALLGAGEPAAAAEALERALRGAGGEQAAAPGEDRWLRGAARARLGEARDRSGDFEGAVSGYRSALAELEGLGGAERYCARVALDAAAALFGLGQLDEARQAALKLLSEKDLSGEIRVRSRILLAGIVYASAGAGSSGLEDALSALALAERERREARLPEKTSEELRALVLSHGGNIHRKLAHLAASDARGTPGRAAAEREEAMLSARRALEAAGAKGLERLAASALANLGELELEAGDRAAARKSVTEALARAQSLRAFETEWRAHWYLSRIAAAEGDPAEAERQLEEAARIVEAHRGRILDSDRKAGFMASKVPLYEAMVRSALERGEGRRAFAAAERSRARSFLESLGLRLLLLGADRDREVYREYLGLLSRAEETARGGGALFGVRASGSYEDLRRKLDTFRKSVRENPAISPVIRALVEGAPASVEEVGRDLLPGERVVEYFGAEDAVAAFVVGPRSFNALRLPADRRKIEGEARRFADGKAQDPALAAALGQALVEPLLPLIEDGAEPVHTLTIVPWGELHRVPFEALSARGRPLISRFAVAYLPAAGVLKYLEKGGTTREKPRRLLALADPDTDYDGDGRPDLPPLLGARAEVAGIAPLFAEAEVLSGREASKAACARLASGREVIHLACHGEFFPARPLDSRLYLSRAEPSDGLLRASEIYGIDLRGSRLVALSGCETGRSSLEGGEDPVGIGISFLHSGAGALLVSLWKVEDRSTAELMKTFYRKWLETAGASRARALREAKMAMLARGAPAAQWASFVLIGSR